MIQSKKFLGTGWKFPVQLDEKTGRVATSSLEEDIKEAIGIILLTNIGERVMRPDFGSGAQDYVFESDSEEFISSVRHTVTEALMRFEPRIEDIDVQVRMRDHSKVEAEIAIGYRVRSNNNYFNLVYPFYLLEGVES